MENTSRFIDNTELSPIQQKVVDYYTENKNPTRIGCAKEVYGNADIFHLKNLSSIETIIRKKGYLFYTSKGKVINMANQNIDDREFRVKVQQRLGGIFFGYLRSNAMIYSVTTDAVQRKIASDQWRASFQKLIDDGYIFQNGVNWNKLKVDENINQLKLI